MPFHLSRTNRSKLLDLQFPLSHNPPPLCPIRLHYFLQPKKNDTVLLTFFPPPSTSPSPIPEWNCIRPTIYLLISCRGSLWDIGRHYYHPCCYCYYTPHSCITYTPSSSLFFSLQTTLEISSRLAFFLFLFILSCTFSSLCHSSFHDRLLFCSSLFCVNERVVFLEPR